MRVSNRLLLFQGASSIHAVAIVRRTLRDFRLGLSVANRHGWRFCLLKARAAVVTEHQAAYAGATATGAIRADETVESRIQAWQDNLDAQQQQQAGLANDYGNAGTPTGGQAAPVARVLGTEVQGNGGLGNTTGNQGSPAPTGKSLRAPEGRIDEQPETHAEIRGASAEIGDGSEGSGHPRGAPGGRQAVSEFGEAERVPNCDATAEDRLANAKQEPPLS